MDGKQLGSSDYELTEAKKETKREKFLSKMEVVVPCQALIALIVPWGCPGFVDRSIGVTP